MIVAPLTTSPAAASQSEGVTRSRVTSARLLRFGEGAQLFGVDVPQLLQLPLASPVQVLDVHHVRLLDASVHPELVADAGDEARLVLAGPEELSVQGQHLLLQLTVPRHRTPGLHHHHLGAHYPIRKQGSRVTLAGKQTLSGIGKLQGVLAGKLEVRSRYTDRTRFTTRHRQQMCVRSGR